MKRNLLLLLFALCVINSNAQKIVTLKSGKTISFDEKTAEYYLHSFITDSTSSLDTTGNGNWFELEQTKFELGKATLQNTALIQLKNITTLLKEFPKLKIKIGCHSDVTGNEQANIALTQARANAYKKYLLANGVKRSSITNAVGYGSQFATCKDVSNQEELAKDRKLVVRVVGF